MGAMNLVFLVKTIFECLEEDDSVRTCDLKPSQTTIILIGSAITSAASLAYKLAHVEVSDDCPTQVTRRTLPRWASPPIGALAYSAADPTEA